MNIKQIIALSALAFAGGAAMADDITIVEDHFVAQKSRAEVRAEVAAARAAGEQVVGEGQSSLTLAAQPSNLTREQVRAELRNAPRSTRAATFNPAA